MHGLIFETSVCYWQNQPGCYRVLWSVQKSTKDTLKQNWNESIQYENTLRLSFPRFGNHDNMYNIISTKLRSWGIIHSLVTPLCDLAAPSNVLSLTTRPAPSRSFSTSPSKPSSCLTNSLRNLGRTGCEGSPMRWGRERTIPTRPCYRTCWMGAFQESKSSDFLTSFWWIKNIE